MSLKDRRRYELVARLDPRASEAGIRRSSLVWVGNPSADDATIMAWAIANGHIVFTHDLDFGTLLALTHATGPSVIQLRTKDVLPDRAAGSLLAALQRHGGELAAGALIVVHESASRVRVLPF